MLPSLACFTRLPQRLLFLSPLPADHALTVTILDRIDILMRRVQGSQRFLRASVFVRCGCVTPCFSDLQQHQDASPRAQH